MHRVGFLSRCNLLPRDFKLHNASKATKDAFSANVVSLLQAGCFFGSLAAAPIGDRLGRRIALGLGAIAFLVGSIMQTASAGSKAVMFVGRAIGGLVSNLALYIVTPNGNSIPWVLVLATDFA